MVVERKSDDENRFTDKELKEMLEDGRIDYNSLYYLICYSMHFIHPAIYGYELLKIVKQIAKQDGIDALAEPYIKYSGYQAQSILSNEKCIDIIDCINECTLIKFRYLQNSDSLIEYNEKSGSENKIVLPYELVYDMRYGRYYMIGLDMDIFIKVLL